jgi:hypothetical protein
MLLNAFQRSERSAEILNQGLTSIRRENEQLQALDRQAEQNAILADQLNRQVLELQTDLAQAQAALDRSQAARASLADDLNQAELAMDTVINRLRGTTLESILNEDTDPEKVLPLQPGQAVILSGEALVSLTVSPTADEQIVRCELVIQSDQQSPAPDTTITLIDEHGDNLTTVAFRFNQPPRQGFVSAVSMLEVGSFPRGARIALSHREVTISATGP